MLNFHPNVIRAHIQCTTDQATRRPRRNRLTLSDTILVIACCGALAYFIF